MIALRSVTMFAHMLCLVGIVALSERAAVTLLAWGAITTLIVRDALREDIR